MNNKFGRKIPSEAESASILVGELDNLDRKITALIRLTKSVALSDFTEVSVPTKFLFIILGPRGNLNKYHEIGRSISTLMSDEIFYDAIYTAKNREEILAAYDVFFDQATVLPPGEWNPEIRIEPPQKVPSKKERLKRIGLLSEDDSKDEDQNDGLEFTGRFCGGLIEDIKRKLPWYLSDFKDGFKFQCLSSILFMYFASLSSIITFGGLLGAVTEQNMSAFESLIAGAISGVLFSLFSGQPVTILSSTGPCLIFESILTIFCKKFEIDYMGFRAWIGLWTAFMLLVVVVTDASVLVKCITKFTEESFSVLVAFIFIKESIAKLIEIRKFNDYSNNPYQYTNDSRNNPDCFRCLKKGNVTSAPLNLDLLNEDECLKLGDDYYYSKKCNYVPDVFFVSICLYTFTFLCAMTLKYLRRSRFFTTSIRSKISDFGVVITIILAVLIDQALKFNTPKLTVPLKFETTIPDRGWFINPLERNKGKIWLIFAAIIPAALATILIFMDQHIPAIIVNRKDNNIKKSFGYHLDMLVIAVTICINSLIGIPWFVAATMLTINHVISLKQESVSSVPGEKPKFLGVIEQRVTGLIVFILIGSSVFLSGILSLIPMPVLYGIFLYMGVSPLNEIEFMHRILLLFMPNKHQPDYVFLRHVRTTRVHIYTIIQIISIVMLFVINMNETISILFPLLVFGLVGVRKALDYVYTPKELSYLDDPIPRIFYIRSKKSVNQAVSNVSYTETPIINQQTQPLNPNSASIHVWRDLDTDSYRKHQQNSDQNS